MIKFVPYILSMMTISALGLLAGGLMIVTLTIIPLFIRLPQEQFVFVHKTIDHHMHPYMPLLSATALLTALIELWLGQLSVQKVVGTIIAIGCIITIVVISEIINVPINRKIAQWTFTAQDEILLQMQKKWYYAHNFRTLAAVTGFFAIVITNLTIVPR